MTKGKIGMNAGAIWNLMADGKTKMSFEALKEETALSDADLWSAIGWLARENRIEILKSGNSYPEFSPGTNFYY